MRNIKERLLGDIKGRIKILRLRRDSLKEKGKLTKELSAEIKTETKTLRTMYKTIEWHFDLED